VSGSEGEMNERIFVRNANVVSRTIGGELFLVPIRGRLADLQRIFALSSVAACIWELLDGEKSIGAVCEGIVERFDVPDERAVSDVREFVAQLLDAGLIEERRLPL
jgi:hypothetical protein